jgi:hypothetical protein
VLAALSADVGTEFTDDPPPERLAEPTLEQNHG